MKKEAWLVFTVLCFIAGIWSCNVDWNSDEKPEDTVSNNITQEPQYAKIVVDNLRMRNTSGLNGQEITQIGIEQFVRLTGNRSDTTESISIRGKTTPYYWHEIIFNGDTGWVYGGGMEILDSLDMSKGGGLNDFQIIPGTRAGLITSESSHESLTQKLGPDDVVKENLHLGEGETVKGTIVYPNTNNEVRIYWQNEDFENIHQIVVSKPGGQWKTDSGIHIGQSIDEVNDINGNPFEMTGFQWDVAGTTLNWQGGNLNSNLTLKFDYHGDISIYPFLSGDVVIASDNSSLLKLNPTVRHISISFTE